MTLSELIERDTQLSIVDSLVHSCLLGKGQVALIAGPVTSGKTELLHTFAERAGQAGLRFVSASCSRLERELPFGVVTQLFQHMPDPGALPASTQKWLDNGLSGAIPTSTESDLSAADVIQAFHALSLPLLELSAETPLLIGIDDLRHADLPSMHFLLYLVRRLRSARVILVVTDDVHIRSTSLPFHAELLRQPNFHEIRVAPLSGNGVTRLLTERLGQPAALRLQPEFLAATGGNPLLLHAMIDDYRTSGDARTQGYGLALLSCVHRGEPAMHQLVRAIAVLGEDVSPAELGQLIGTEPDSVKVTLSAMTAAGLLDNGKFRHPVAQQAVLDEMPASELSNLHSRAAQVLHDMDKPAIEVARHLRATSNALPGWAVGVLTEAAGQAQLSGRPDQAARYLELALRIPRNEEERITLQVRLARAEWQVSPWDASRHLDPLITAAHSGKLRCLDECALVKDLLWHDRDKEASELLAHIRQANAGSQAESVELRDFELWLMYTHPQMTTGRRLPVAVSRTDSPAAPHPDPWLRSAAGLSVALARGQCHDVVDRAEQVLLDVPLSRNTPWADEAALLAIQVLQQADAAATAARWCDQLLTAARKANSPTSIALFANARAGIALKLGDFAAAAEYAQSALRSLPLKAWGVAASLPLGNLILAATRRGDYDEAASLLTVPPPDGRFSSRYSLNYLHARGHYYLATSHFHAAIADFLACGELMRKWGLDVAGLVPWRAAAGEAWLRLGNQDQSRQLVYDQLTRLGTARSHTRGLSLRLLAVASPPARRLQLLTEALELFEGIGDRFEQARVLADLGRTHNNLGKNRRARLLLRQALHVANMCDAKPLSQELLSISDPVKVVATAPDDGTSTLTESERRVASLAVMGYTNREIAARLFVTTSTVEQHLTRVFRKLNVKRRRDLPVDLWTEATKTV
jgi:DNA-binding CsgD family transcriptional regulator/tetratricopeptide (TPR) repeat protein